MAFELLAHERYVYSYSGEINREDINTETGCHDVLLDWGYPSDSDLLQDVEAMVFEAFNDMLEHARHVTNELGAPGYDTVSKEVFEALGELAFCLGNDYAKVDVHVQDHSME